MLLRHLITSPNSKRLFRDCQVLFGVYPFECFAPDWIDPGVWALLVCVDRELGMRRGSSTPLQTLFTGADISHLAIRAHTSSTFYDVRTE